MAEGDARAPWAVSAAAALAALGTDASGIGEEEAARRLAAHGPNEIEKPETVRPLAILLRQFRSPLIYILILAAIVTVALDEYLDAGVIAAVLVFNAVVGFFQEYRAERSLEALRRLARTRARVLRDGRERELDAREVVPGDVVLVEAGSKVPADCRVIHQTALECDESLLTGESATVAKTTASLPPDTPVADRHNMLFMGTVVTRGRARAVASATGSESELGQVAGEVQRITPSETPLQRRMGRFTRLVGIWALANSLLGFALGLAAGEDVSELFRAMVALAVAALPEGLPIVLTITLAISVNRMARRGAIVRRLPAVETLGSCTVIGSDKTGTLTQNRMAVERVYAAGRSFGLGPGAKANDLPAAGHLESDTPLELTLRAGAIANDASLVAAGDGLQATGDPTEVALLDAAARAGLSKDDLDERFPRVAEIPFDSDNRYAATYNRADGRMLVFVKGAPERVLEMCTHESGVDSLDAEAVLAEAQAMAGQGLRVLAMAYRDLGGLEPGGDAEPERPRDLTFLGLQGMMDPPRPEVVEAIEQCKRAGIRVVMITGDHAATALAIAGQLRIADGERAITGVELDRCSEHELDRLVGEVAVYARVSPEHKLRIVKALQRRGDVVAVTGDGVNDAPALEQADIGAAMGRSGTDVAKEAADMVITDDNFATVFAAVREGRVAFDNVRKTTFFLISSNAAAVLGVLASVAIGLPLPFVAVQLLWLNLVTNGVQDIALAFEPGEEHLIDQPPRSQREGVLSRLLWERTAVAAVVIAGGTLLMFELQRSGGASLEEARTVALTTMVVFQTLHVGNSRSEHLSAFAKSPFSNPFLLIGTLGALAVHVAALYVPATQFALHLEPIALGTWLEIFAVAFSVIVAVEAHKLLRSRRH